MRQQMEIMVSSKSVDWYTPKWIIALAKRCMGRIDLDPASCIEANNVVGARAFIIKEKNGLLHNWEGNVWLNPPYGRIGNRSSQGAWARKLEDEYRSGRVTQGLLLVRNAAAYPWFEDLWDKWPACFIRQLVVFNSPDKVNNVDASKHGNTIFYVANKALWENFVRSFGSAGIITLPDGRYYNDWSKNGEKSQNSKTMFEKDAC